MKTKHTKAILVAGITIIVILIVALLITSPSYAGTGSPFIGEWLGTDGDGSDIRMVIAGNPDGSFHITATDSYLSSCQGGAGIVQGTAFVNPQNSFVLDANIKVICFTTGGTHEFTTNFFYNANPDTLSGMWVTWYRAGSSAPACVVPPMGMTGWWPGDGNAEDIKDHRAGYFMGDATIGPGLVDKAFVLDGVDDYIEVPDDPAFNFGTWDFTVDLWVNFNDLSGEQVLVEKWIQGYPISQGWTLTKLENQVLLLAMDDGLGGEWGVGSMVLDLKSNTWYHFAASRMGQLVTLSMNGVAIASAEIDPLNLDASTSLKFGRRGDDRGFYLNGRIDEVQIYNSTALAQDQIYELYSAGRLGNCKDYINGAGIRAHPVTDVVDAWWWPEDRMLTLTVDDPSTSKTPDIRMRKSGADIYAGTVWFDLAGYDLKPGDIVTMTDGLVTKTLTLSNVAITSVDVGLNRVLGTADPGVWVRLPVLTEMFTQADQYGNWVGDYSGTGYQLQPDMMMLAEHFDSDGDLTMFEYRIPAGQ